MCVCFNHVSYIFFGHSLWTFLLVFFFILFLLFCMCLGLLRQNAELQTIYPIIKSNQPVERILTNRYNLSQKRKKKKTTKTRKQFNTSLLSLDAFPSLSRSFCWLSLPSSKRYQEQPSNCTAISWAEHQETQRMKQYSSTAMSRDACRWQHLFALALSGGGDKINK